MTSLWDIAKKNSKENGHFKSGRFSDYADDLRTYNISKELFTENYLNEKMPKIAQQYMDDLVYILNDLMPFDNNIKFRYYRDTNTHYVIYLERMFSRSSKLTTEVNDVHFVLKSNSIVSVSVNSRWFEVNDVGNEKHEVHTRSYADYIEIAREMYVMNYIF